ncbi:hypothetical protein TPE_1257 [Treponema pedis str. T A4]|uniref:Uncharacterized protein n=1 Tax=Treponema pedis str. T A4 TaxID=1291379 RepID=S5ZMC8_9SPIR|nr:hypothetical protein TPE_1257 [Treponema pedis str. T A4]
MPYIFTIPTNCIYGVGTIGIIYVWYYRKNMGLITRQVGKIKAGFKKLCHKCKRFQENKLRTMKK